MSDSQKEGDVLVEEEEMDFHEEDSSTGTVEERTNPLPVTETQPEVSTAALGLDPTSDTDDDTLVGESEDVLTI